MKLFQKRYRMYVRYAQNITRIIEYKEYEDGTIASVTNAPDVGTPLVMTAATVERIKAYLEGLPTAAPDEIIIEEA